MATYFFWACAAAVTYAYVGYPIAIWLASKLFGRAPEPPGTDADRLPTVTLLVAAYNEAAVIGDWLDHALAIEYPPGKLEVLVASDGSDDGTAVIVSRFAGQGVRLLNYSRRRGKSAVLNAAVQEATGELVVLTDANTQVPPGTVRLLARWFLDPAIGTVCGRLVLLDPGTGRNGDGAYWRYETFLKRCESRLGALLGANGAIYAIRKSRFVPIPDGTIIDDFVIPLLSRLRHGGATVYDDQAVAFEESPPGVRDEFHRRARIGAGGFPSLGLLWPYFAPSRGWVAFAFVSHKVLRWFCPFFLIGLFGAGVLLRGDPFYRAAVWAQTALYSVPLIQPLVPARSPLFRALHVAGMFTSMNAALLLGFFRWVFGTQAATWKRTARAGDGRSSS